MVLDLYRQLSRFFVDAGPYIYAAGTRWYPSSHVQVSHWHRSSRICKLQTTGVFWHFAPYILPIYAKVKKNCGEAEDIV